MNAKLKLIIEVIAIITGSVSILALVFGWGGVFSTYRADVADAKQTAIDAKTQSNTNTTQLNEFKVEVNTKLDFILGRYGGQWNPDTQRVEIKYGK